MNDDMKKKKEGKKIVIIECPTNLGLSKMPYSDQPGVIKLPEWLNKWGFHSGILPHKKITVNAPLYGTVVDEETKVRNANAIIEYAITQSKSIEKELNENSFLFVLGGDCSILIGTAIALRRKGNYGLFYLDGHTDYIKPEQSNTHGAAGMDLAIVCGYGHSKLTNISNLSPYINPKNVFCVGNREYDDAYEAPVKNSAVEYVPLNKLRENGIEATVSQFLKMTVKNHLDGFFIHFDVDVLNDSIMPAVDSRQDDGLSYAELKLILPLLINNSKAFGLEITILDPDLDKDGKHTRNFIDNLIEIFKESGLI